MPQQQLVGLALLALAIADTAVGHLVIAPRVADERKRQVLRIAFSISGLGIAALGVAVYRGLLRLS